MARNKYPEETVQKILDAALKVFLEKGYEKTTVLDIVDNMGGLTRGAFYHHFKSKEEVLDALGDHLFETSKPFERTRQQTHLDGLGKLKYLMDISMEDSDARKISLVSVQALESPTFLKRLLEDNNNVLSPFIQELIEEGVRDGSIKTEHPKLLSQLVLLLTNFWSIPTIFPSTLEESVERVEYTKELLDMAGLPLLSDEMIDTMHQSVDRVREMME